VAVAHLCLVRSVRELIERFSYRYQLWREEQEAERWGPDSAQRNPLRYVAGGLLVGIILALIEPWLFHRPARVLDIAFVPAALIFLILYRRNSKFAWHICVFWVLFTFFAYWVFRLAGYQPYQPRAHENVSFTLLSHVVLCAFSLIWLFRMRERYFRYIDATFSHPT
jgi:hypothetical protein